ncbi:MAG TPA: baseplate J/gp47 family protein [Anaerolineales bacterium]
MKLQLIHLDPEDDQISAREKLSWARASRAVLVWPRRGRVLTRRLDLVLLQRQAQHQAVELGLVTYDPTVRQLAQELGLPTFDSPDHLPESGWQTGRTPAPPARPTRKPVQEVQRLAEQIPTPAPTLLSLSSATRNVSAGLAALCALAVAASILPSAEITLAPRPELQTLPIEFIVDPALEPPASGRHLPAESMKVSLEGERRSPATGTARLPSAAATGAAVLTNLTSEEVTVPAGTGLWASASAVRFTTTEALTLPAESEAEGEVPIQAAAPGPQGNLPAGALDAVEGLIGFQVRATNPDPTTGGADSTASAVSAADRFRLRTSLLAELQGRALSEMSEALAPGLTLVPGSLEISQILQEQFDFEVGQPTATLGLLLQVEFSGVVVSTEQVETAATRLLEADMPAGSLVVPDSLLLRRDPARDGRRPSGEYTLAYLAEQQIAESLDFEQVRRAAAGRWSESAPSLLAERFQLDRPALIRSRPAWLPWLPWLEIRLDVRWIWEPA